ncbi:phage tail protein [Pseudomonas triticifolii]|uniref:Tail fiber protein n=1 Tax=Pseudomonas triticifolii TaxID=2762592 RepID=A0ABR7B942_9PSED|nr:tail fiber protein [Pseudomonas triticifolii]MBC3953684.1 tail fiber protein [Pseudomonas triticifolii]
MDAFLGTILIWPANYAPHGWAFCNGAELQVQQYQALYAVIGNIYGGTAGATFKLPNLCGRVPMGAANFPPSTTQLATQGGAASSAVTGGVVSGTVNIQAANLPPHSHPASLSLSGLTGQTKVAVSLGTNGQTTATEGAALSSTATSGPTSAAIFLPSTPSSTVNLGGVNTTVTGTGSVTVGANSNGGQPLAINLGLVGANAATLPPFQTVTYIICLQGIWPSRN